MAEIIRINEDTVRIEDGGGRFFLLEGTEKALLIDTGMNNIKPCTKYHIAKKRLKSC